MKPNLKKQHMKSDHVRKMGNEIISVNIKQTIFIFIGQFYS